MSKLKTMKDALLNELKDLYSAETQLLKALPRMQKKAENKSLKEAIGAHLNETEKQVERLDQIASLMGEKLTGKTCKAMQGLLEEGKEVIEEDSENVALIDALLIGAAQRVEHYEIAGYGTARAMADALGENEIVALLQETLDEESAADEKLSMISEEEVLPDVLEMGSDEEDEEEKRMEKSMTKKGRKSSDSAATRLACVGCALAMGIVSAGVSAEDRPREQVKNEQEAASYQKDNTGRNARDVNEYRKTADDQDLSGDNTELLASIRSEIVKNDDLSTYGKNVKIIVENGAVTLRGPVRSQQEKTWIASTATKIAPKHQVVNELEIAPS